MRVCVFGNSHIAAMHLGWKQISASYPNIEFVFFGAPNGDMSGVEFTESTLVATEEAVAENLRRTGGSDRIVLADYDAMVAVGFRIGLAHYRHFLRPARLYNPQSGGRQAVVRETVPAAAGPSAFSSSSFLQRLRTGAAKLLSRFLRKNIETPHAKTTGYDEPRAPKAKSAGGAKGRMISKMFMTKAVERMVRESRLYYFADEISSKTDMPVYFVATPNFSTYSTVKSEKHKRKQDKNGDWNAPFADVFWNGLTAALAGKAIVVRQPEETVFDHVFTKEQYGLARKATTGDDEEIEMIDYVHMNADYGAIVMRDLIARMSAAIDEKNSANTAAA